MKAPKCKTCGKEHALGGCPEFKQRVNGHSQHEGANAQAIVQNEVVTVVGTESGTVSSKAPFDRVTYQREYMRKYRAKAKGKT